MTIVRELDLETLVLKPGAHTPDGVMCVMEAVAFVAGEPWSDSPQCVSPVLSSFARTWNDGMRTDEERDSLKPYITRLIGTAGDAEADERRAWLATDWLVRVCAPAWLRLAGLNERADALVALQPIANAAYAASVQGEIEAARREADAARAAAGAAAWDAAWAAAGAAARAAAGAAAWDAAWDAARAAAGAAAWAAAWDAAWAAAWDAAWDALEPTVLALQVFGHVLFDLMIDAAPCPERWPELVVVA